LLQE
jgi:hypothetical protein